MRVLDSSVSRVGLVRKLVERGYGDIKISIHNVEIISVKSILCLGNDIFKRLIGDDQFIGSLVLYDGISEIGFYILERFYTGESIDINNNNIIDIIAVCLFYNEEKLLQSAKRYLKSHLDETTVLSLIKLMNSMSDKKMIEFHDITGDYLYRYGYKYLNDNAILNFRVNELYYILTSPKLVVESETELLMKLLYYKENNLKSEEESKDFSKLLKVINWKSIELDKIPSDKLEHLKQQSFSFFDQLNNVIPTRVYLKLPKDLLDISKDIIIKYYTEENKMIEIEKQDKMILLESKIIDYFKSLLDIDDKKLTIVTMTIIIDLDISYEIESEKRSFMMSQFLLWHSQVNDNSIKETIPKCLSYFIKNKKNIKAFQQLFGISMLFDILNHINVCSSSFRVLMKYMKNKVLTKEELDNLNPIVQNIYNSEEELSLEYHSQQICSDSDVKIIPSIKPSIGRYSISPELFKGLYLDEQTGIIYGKCDEERILEKFEITCKTPYSVLSTTLELSVSKYGFVSDFATNELQNMFKLINTNSLIHHCYLNFEIKDDEIWHLLYLLKDESDNNYDDEFFEELEIGFGGTTNNQYEGINLTYEKFSFGACFLMYSNKCWISSYNTTEKSFCECSRNRNGDIFECIYNMKGKTFEIIKNRKENIVTICNIPSKIYPYVESFNDNYAIHISSIWKE